MQALAELTPELEGHRAELIGYCYRMLGSATDLESGPIGLGVLLSFHAEDAETLYGELKDRGVPIITEPFDTPFGRTFVFSDPDGYQIAVHGA
jgi:predicted enzyme related to lactoylglutathione lyase